ncbi:MAG: hypothetical protein JWM37_649 [Candidatus Saccharibacteria bacterium]|nr:hypothetical protein [Candidatus Saccharibacteria bacterium]
MGMVDPKKLSQLLAQAGVDKATADKLKAVNDNPDAASGTGHGPARPDRTSVTTL